MRTRSAITTAALTAFGLLVLGCAIPEPEDPADPFDPPTQTATDATPEPSGSVESLEGLYDYDTMDVFADRVVRELVNPWVRDTWPGMPLPDVVYVASGESGPQPCTDADGNPAEYSDISYEYCPADATVYLGQETLWELYSGTGDAGPAMGIAHEFGHHIQYELGVSEPRTIAQSIDFENQADCLSGAWARYGDEQEWLETPDDLEDIEMMFPIIASAEGEDRDHGTLEEREQAFADGFEGGVVACGLNEG